MKQWLENLDVAMRQCGAGDLATFSRDRLENVSRAAAQALIDRRYKKALFPRVAEVKSGLGCGTASWRHA